MIDLKYWNPNVRFERMRKEEIYKLRPGDEAYYVNTSDELFGIVYKVIIKEVYEHHIEMECHPVTETIPEGGWIPSYIRPHMESFAYADICSYTNQTLHKRIILLEENET